MTLVSDSPHVASLLRINISKFGYALQAFFILRYSPHVASLLRINISKLGCALQANFMLRYSPHVASLLRINISKFGYALQAYLTKSYHRFTAFSLAGKTASIALGFIYALQARFIKSNRKEHTVHFA